MRESGEFEAWGADLDLAPMLDVIFLLVIFFLATTRFAETERDIRVNPPHTQTPLPLTLRTLRFVVNVTSEGEYFLGTKKCSLKQLDEILRKTSKAQPNQSVIIRGDEKVALGAVAKVLALCEKYKLKRKYLTVVSRSP